jgi:hypothetical protein
VKYSHAVLGEVVLAMLVGSCAPSIPTAPDLGPVLNAYENPTAEVGSEIMSVVADGIAEAAQEIEDSDVFQEILDVIIEVQMELDTAIAMTCEGGAMNGKTCTRDEDCPDGTCTGPSSLILGGVCEGGSNAGNDCATDADCPGGTCTGGVTLPTPTGAFQINYICPGWDPQQFDEGYDDSPDSDNGSIDLFMTLDSGGIGRVVWGTAARCLYLVPNEGDDCAAAGCTEALFDGGVALDLGPDWVSEDISELPVTFVVEGNIGLDGDDFRINQSFRVTLAEESGLTILVDIGDPALSETFNYIFAETYQCIRDKNPPAPDSETPECSFGCSLEESRCFDESGTLFSW